MKTEIDIIKTYDIIVIDVIVIAIIYHKRRTMRIKPISGVKRKGVHIYG